MDQEVQKLLYSKREAAHALSLSVRSIDCLITTRHLSVPPRQLWRHIWL